MAVGIKWELFNGDSKPQNAKRCASAMEVAFYFGVSRRTVYKWVQMGLLEANKVNGKTLCFNLEQIEAWTNRLQLNPPSRRPS